MRQRKISDITGHVYGKLTVLYFVERRDLHSFWYCKCDCGKYLSVRANSLRTGSSLSCGCVRIQKLIEKRRTHNESGKTPTKEYHTWTAIRQRCLSKTSHAYKDYGGRGITICDRWLNSYENFLSDMGRAPSKKHSIERLKNNQGYSPENCKWATRAEQANNKRSSIIIDYRGKQQTLKQWCNELGVNYYRVHAWIHRKKLTFPEALIEYNSRLVGN